MTTNSSGPPPRRRGRPRKFDPDQAVATAQALFLARGYDALGVADITEALGINPPSFYAAFGSKAGLFARVLERYNRCNALPLDTLLSPARPVEEALAALLEDAANRYAADAANPAAGGCLVLEGQRCNDPTARDAASALNAAAVEAIRAFIAARHPAQAEALTDYVVAVLTGLSTAARAGHGRERLLATAALAERAVRAALTP
ncbi:TetR/AcrR family transcriptional regulator [Roseomonas sp. KE2513]|uniref:helix-turn-helix domain-containing protein n=1 Tax=Roseomonas sp. KE2513 TaxID=2479202 RepID=UPI0018E03CCB|nr:TetR/AcrR family transcriptional regulator [Roseomonas sp. KE2513]MBI0534138.1 TetR/AcrR family transcriptional regulator [Roseomonas sp. KE2513]